MKKLIIFSLAFMLTFAMSGLTVFAEIEQIQTADPFPVTTGFVPVMGGGEAPIVKVKWEMNKTVTNAVGEDGTDDVPEQPGAQFLPSGEYAVDKNIWVCAVATDPEGLTDVAAVYADIYYPDGYAFHWGSDDPDVGALGCGMQHNYEIELQKLDKPDSWNLFCGSVRNNNSGMLPTFAPNYDFDEMCAEDGELTKGTAAVYCKYMDLDYEDPAGMYTVDVHAVDGGGIKSNHVINDMEYLPVTAFETDFDAISYGNVKLDTHKEINGDLTWYDNCDRATNLASVRNVGNTRLNMTVEQDDMGLGQTENGELTWNVHWDARVGSYAPFSLYDPFDDPAVLEDILDLSELEEMDFSILVDKFPTDIENYQGTMTLGALQAPFRACDGSQVPTDLLSHQSPFGDGYRYPGQYVRPPHDPDPICEPNGEGPETRNISLENKTADTWLIISDDQIYGDIEYSHNYNDFHGTVTGTGLVPGGYYQITFNSQPDCPSFTAASLAGAGSNAFESGYWNGGLDLDPTCIAGGEGVFNIDLIDDHYTFIADGNGAFSHPFSLNLPAGDYVDVKVLVKKMLDTHESPWADTTGDYPKFNLYETASINFTVLP